MAVKKKRRVASRRRPTLDPTRKAVYRLADGLVDNIIALEAGAQWTPPAGHDIVDDSASQAQIGGTWDGTKFTAPPPFVPDPLDVDGQRIYDYMPVSGSATATAVTNYIQNTANDPAIRATMATLRSLIRKEWRERQV